MNDKLVNICVIHYNTPELLEALILSIKKFVPKYHIYIFENSDKKPFKCNNTENDNITIFNNSKGDIINFNLWLNNFKNKSRSIGVINGWGSAKHCFCIDKCFDLIGENFILLDSDVLLKKDISELFNEEYYSIGEVSHKNSRKSRILPFICFINVKKCKEKNIHYFDGKRMLGLASYTCSLYDTGASFLEDIKKNGGNVLEIRYNDYIEHYGAGSYSNKVNKKHTKEEWLNKNRKLYE